MKKLIIILCAMLGLGLAAQAQSLVGTWEIFPSYSTPKKVFETPEFLYVHSGNSLTGYDKTTGESIAFSTANRLNSNQVSNIWYSVAEKCLFVLYNDFNIDLVFDDGRTVNVPDLREAVVTGDKSVMNVAFAEGNAYVGLKTGMMVVDMAHGAVTESCLWGKQVTSIFVTPAKIVVWIGWSGENMYVADRNVSHHNFDVAFTKSKRYAYPNATGNALVPIATDKFLMPRSDGKLYLMSVDDSATDNSVALSYANAINGITGVVAGSTHQVKDGAVALGAGKIFYVASDGTLSKTVDLAAAKGKAVSDWSSNGSKIWIADANGFGLYDVAAAKYEISPSKPSGTSGSNVGIIKQLTDGSLIMSTLRRAGLPDSKDGMATFVDRYEPGRSFSRVPGTWPNGLYSFDVSPLDENTIVASFRSSVKRYDATTGTAQDFTAANAGIEPGAAFLLFNDITVDKYGNLWLMHNSLGAGNQWTVYIYKALKGSWEGTPKPEGWSKLALTGLPANDHSGRFLIDTERGIAVVTGRAAAAAVELPAPTAPLTASTRFNNVTLVADEDGGGIDLLHIPNIVLDKKGWIWMCGNSLVVVRDPRDLLDAPASFSPMRPKVPRNDGTGLADYLLYNAGIMSISVDENDEKWIATYGSGLYRVSPDGTEILEHFTSENSGIPTDIVYCAVHDKFSPKVFVGTELGFAVYHSTTAPAATDYSDVYAYPNPVTPDYTGYITISGLKSDSLVKIADAKGNVFFETTSNGGMALWNGCDASGRRVRSGVYFVYASQGGTGGTGAVVTKIVVVN